MMNGKVIWTSDKRIASVFNSLQNNFRRAAGYQMIKWILLMTFPSDNPGAGGRVAGMGDNGGELFSKSCCYFCIAGEEFEGKRHGLIGRGLGKFPFKGFDYTP